MAEENNNKEIPIYDPLETPQIAYSERAQKRLAKGAPMPGLNVDTEDGEVDRTIDERINDLEKSLGKKLH